MLTVSQRIPKNETLFEALFFHQKAASCSYSIRSAAYLHPLIYVVSSGIFLSYLLNAANLPNINFFFFSRKEIRLEEKDTVELCYSIIGRSATNSSPY